MKNTQQLQALQNAADFINLKIHIQPEQDNRKKIAKFYATKNNISVSPSSLDYNQMNHFLHGWLRCQETNLNKHHTEQ